MAEMFQIVKARNRKRKYTIALSAGIPIMPIMINIDGGVKDNLRKLPMKISSHPIFCIT